MKSTDGISKSSTSEMTITEKKVNKLAKYAQNFGREGEKEHHRSWRKEVLWDERESSVNYMLVKTMYYGREESPKKEGNLDEVKPHG